MIMDGNGRWAKRQGKPRVFGHKSGVKSVREVTEGCAELGIKYLTLYAFSTENWNRPKLEVTALMALLVETIKTEVSVLNKNNIRLETIGNSDYYATGLVSIHNDPKTLLHAARNCLSLNTSKNSYKKYKNYSKLPNRYIASQILRFSFIKRSLGRTLF
mgnify:CR=1 FL=1